MASARGKAPEDESKASRRKRPAAHTPSLGEGDRPNPSMMLTLQTPRSLHTLQRTVGNRAVVDMIANSRAQTSPGLLVQREGGSAGSAVRSGGTRLYVGNLSLSTTQQTLEAAFSAAGEVRDVHLVTDRETGQPRGFGFVTMGSSKEAHAAITQFNGAMVDGRPLKVNEAQERSTSGGGAGGYGGGGGGGGRGRGGGGGRGRY
jgi:cold-inducible RNA-binding protein